MVWIVKTKVNGMKIMMVTKDLRELSGNSTKNSRNKLRLTYSRPSLMNKMNSQVMEIAKNLSNLEKVQMILGLG